MDENLTFDEVRAYFSGDRFATEACGCKVVEAAPGHAVCSFDIEPRHLNAQGFVMGGAIFTLADFALAIASNLGQTPSVSVSSTIEYFDVARGSRLIATADEDRSGRHLGFYKIAVTDELGTKVALCTATCFHKES